MHLNQNEHLLFHGSRGGIVGKICPNYKGAREHGDFGKGFYMGTTELQPKSLVVNDENPVFYTLKLNSSDLRVKSFEANFEWIVAVAYFRGRLDRLPTQYLQQIKKQYEGFDLFYGYIADDSTTAAITQFIADRMGYTSLMNCLCNLSMGKQYVAVTQRACDNIAILDSYELPKTERKLIKQSASIRIQASNKITNEAFANPNQGKRFSELLAVYLEGL